MRVVSWNVLADVYVRRAYYPRTAPELFDPAARRRRVVERLAGAARADVVCLQEVDTALFAQARETLGWAAGRLLCKSGREEGCAIFVRKPLAAAAAWRELIFADDSGYVALAVRAGDVTFVSTHLKWAPDETPAAEHPGRAQLAELLAAWPSGKRVICGDLNAEPGSVVLAVAAAHGLRDAYTSLPAAFTCNANARKKRIDFILCSKGLRATPEPIPPIDDLTPLPSELEPSDHLAIAARIDS